MYLLGCIIIAIMIMCGMYLIVLSHVKETPKDMEEVYTIFNETGTSLVIKTSNLDKKIVKWGVYRMQDNKPVDEHLFIWYKPVRTSNGADILGYLILRKRREYQNKFIF